MVYLYTYNLDTARCKNFVDKEVFFSYDSLIFSVNLLKEFFFKLQTLSCFYCIFATNLIYLILLKCWHRFTTFPQYNVIVNNTNIFKDTQMEKAPPNKTPALRKSTNVVVWVVGTLSQLFIRGS